MNNSLTPISDFIDDYVERAPLRLHMPGHKGATPETAADITEVCGADSLFEAEGIIFESEKIASDIFGAHTFYSTEGSSLAIRAMLYLAGLYGAQKGKQTKILAARNVHKTFLTAAALLDFEVDYILSESYLSCKVSPQTAEKYLSSGEYTALYITSPDYLGACGDINALRQVCDRFGVLLLVDNAHGAYLKFLAPSRHPMDCGAHMCCDSAHKTLGVLTGGAYLHISKEAPEVFVENAKRALALFASTSPSYLILRSLDKANAILGSSFSTEILEICASVSKLKESLSDFGYTLYGDEELKITICPKDYGYTGNQLADILREMNIEIEFSDPDFVVMMFSPATGKDGVLRLEKALLGIERREPIAVSAPQMQSHRRAMTPREAIMSPCESVRVEDAEGRILADMCVGCPPAVPLLICGEIIEKADMEAFIYYGIYDVKVVKS